MFVVVLVMFHHSGFPVMITLSLNRGSLRLDAISECLMKSPAWIVCMFSHLVM